MEGEEEYRRVCFSLQHVRMFQILVRDNHFPGGENPGLAQENLPETPLETQEDFDIIVGVVMACQGRVRRTWRMRPG